jgi:hypothetical protein
MQEYDVVMDGHQKQMKTAFEVTDRDLLYIKMGKSVRSGYTPQF